MTRNDVKAAVEEVRAAKGDFEAAHSYEDRLHLAVLRYIALKSTDANARALAAEAVKTAKIDFARHCA